MNIGMLWFDNDPKTTLEQKISKAAAYYQNKNGTSANRCYVSSKAISEQMEFSIDGVQVSGRNGICLHYFWMGVE